MTKKRDKRKPLGAARAIALIAAIMILVAACGEAEKCSYDDKKAADLSGYKSIEDIRLVDTTVKEIEKMMKDGETFAFIASFADCPFCNQLMPYFNEAAKRAGRRVGHLDTRKDPKWKNNMDIDDYDTFVKLFGKYLDKEEDGKEHLYTPMIFFIKNGEIVAYHKNVIEGAEDPNSSLTKTQENKLNKMLDEKFEQMN